jgi:phage terminase large subunit-like protein
MKAEEDGPAQMALIASQHFNVEVDQALRSDGWAGATLWPRGAEKGLTLPRGHPPVGSSDGRASTAAASMTFSACSCWAAKRERASGSLGLTLLSRRKVGSAARQTARIYEDFIKDGDLTLVERLPDDVTAVVDIVKQCLDSGKLAKVGADPAGLGSIVDELAKIGVTQENELLGRRAPGRGADGRDQNGRAQAG